MLGDGCWVFGVGSPSAEHPTPNAQHPVCPGPRAPRPAGLTGGGDERGGPPPPGRTRRTDVSIYGREAHLGLLLQPRPAASGLPAFGADLARWARADAARVSPVSRQAGARGHRKRLPALVLLSAAPCLASGLLAASGAPAQPAAAELPHPPRIGGNGGRPPGSPGPHRSPLPRQSSQAGLAGSGDWHHPPRRPLR